MKHRVEIDVSFENEQDAVDLLNYIEGIKHKAFNPSGTEKIACNLKCRYHECSHDDIEPKPCSGYVSVDFKQEKITHQVKEEKI